MREKVKKSKGFAMAELLAVCIIVLGIFSMLFANYLPLLAEYENRINYNNVTAQYASHYIRKIYKKALEDPSIGDNIKDTINEGITSGNGVYEVYGKNNTSILNQFSSDKKLLESLIDAYKIEEIVITKYVLEDAKNSYNGDSLKNYINYLPSYKNSIYTGENADENKELYRLIIKTKNYGYATTPILSDYKTPVDCFTGRRSSNGGIIITTYNEDNDNELCTTDVTIGSGNIRISNGAGGIVSGQIVGIGESAFKDKGLTSISFPTNQIKTIEDEAFAENPDLSTFDFTGITNIGNSAFSNTGLTEVVLSNTTHYGNNVFTSCNNLKTVTVNNDITTIGTGLFAQSGSVYGLNITINGLKNIPNNMFQNSKINNLKLLGSSLQSIGDNAFNKIDSPSLSLEIPDSVTSIGTKSFANAKIGSLTFNNNDNQSLTIKNQAFQNIEINGNNKGVSIPANVAEIGESAFENAKINSLIFEENSKITMIKSDAFKSNDLVTLILPNSLETIGSGAFSNNISLKDVNLPINNNYKSISSDLFSGNTNLININIPSNVTEIGENAFSNNSSLKAIEIPANVVSIGNGAFSECPALGITEGDFINNSNANFNWCNIFYNKNYSSCTIETEGINTYIKYPELQDKIIVKGGAIENEQ